MVDPDRWRPTTPIYSLYGGAEVLDSNFSLIMDIKPLKVEKYHPLLQGCLISVYFRT